MARFTPPRSRSAALCALSVLLAFAPAASRAAAAGSTIHCVRFDGSQYIDTGVPARTGVKIELVAEWSNPDADNGVFGARVGDTRFYPVHVCGGRLSYGAGSFNQISGATIAANTVYTIVSDFADGLQTISLDGTTVWSGTAATGMDLGANLYLGAVNYSGAKYGCAMKVHSARIWLDGDLVHDYRPDFRDGVAGFRDAAAGDAFVPSSNTSFAIVPRWTPGPPDAFVEWVAGSAGSYGGVDTLVPAKSGLAFEGKMRWTAVDAVHEGKEFNYLGAYRSKQNYLAPVHIVSNQLWLAYGNGSTYGTHRFFLTHADGTPATVAKDADNTFHAVMSNGVQSLVWNGETVHSGTLAQAVDFDDDIAVFAAGSWGGFNETAGARCYWLKVWKDDELVRDFVPGAKGGEGVLYDRVNDRCHYGWEAIPAGRIGPASQQATKPVRFAEYVASTGTHYIDTSVEGRAGTKVEADVAWTSQDGDIGLIGSRKDWGDTRFYPIHYYGDLDYGYGKFVHSAATVPVGERHVVVSDFSAGSQTVALDGETVVDAANAADIRTGLPMYLFAENVVGTAMYHTKARLYGLKIWQDGALVRDFVPVVCDNGAAALWDNCGKRLYCDANGGDFWDHGETGGLFVRGTMIVVR